MYSLRGPNIKKLIEYLFKEILNAVVFTTLTPISLTNTNCDKLFLTKIFYIGHLMIKSHVIIINNIQILLD